MNNLLFLFIFVPILAVALLVLNVLLSVHRPDEDKVSAYECGFQPIIGQTRSTFQIHFFLVALLFLIFDLEILLIFPIAVTLYQVSTFGFSIAIIFFIVLTIGFVLEIGSGAIKLVSNEVVNFELAAAAKAASSAAASAKQNLLTKSQMDRISNLTEDEINNIFK